MENVTITIKMEVSPDTYKHVSNIENLTEILQRATEKRFYEIIMRMFK